MMDGPAYGTVPSVPPSLLVPNRFAPFATHSLHLYALMLAKCVRCDVYMPHIAQPCADMRRAGGGGGRCCLLWRPWAACVSER